MALHPLLVAALIRHREEQKMLGLYEDDGFLVPTRSGAPMTMSNPRRAFKTLCKNTGLGDGWTTYELRHSFVSLVSDQLDDLVKVADLAGHVDTRTTAGYGHSVRAGVATRSGGVERAPRGRGRAGHQFPADLHVLMTVDANSAFGRLRRYAWMEEDAYEGPRACPPEVGTWRADKRC